MPGSPLPGALEVVEYYPNASDRAGSISKFHDSLKIVAKAPGFEGIVFDGYSKEEEGVSWRVVKWASYDAHMKDFRESDLFKQYDASRQGAITKPPSVKHYEMYDKYPFDPKPECVEFVTMQIKPEYKFEDFYPHWSEALKLVTAYPGCPFIALGKCIENPQEGLQVQPWMTLEAHLVGFKKDPNVDDVMKKLTVVVEKYVEGGWKGFKARHVMLTADGEAIAPQ